MEGLGKCCGVAGAVEGMRRAAGVPERAVSLETRARADNDGEF